MRKTIKIVLWVHVGIMVLILLIAIIAGTADKSRAEKTVQTAQLVSDNEIKNLAGNPIPYEKWAEWGNPTTLENTDNSFWFAYLDKADISFVSEKSNDIIIFAIRGRKNIKDLVFRADVWFRCKDKGLIFSQCFPN